MCACAIANNDKFVVELRISTNIILINSLSCDGQEVVIIRLILEYIDFV